MRFCRICDSWTVPSEKADCCVLCYEVRMRQELRIFDLLEKCNARNLELN